MAFEYSCRFSVDEDIIQRYNCSLLEGQDIVRFAIEIRSNFTVKGISDYERIIASERYAIPSCREELLRHDMVHRLKQYWMTDGEIKQLIDDALQFGKRIAAAGRRGMIPIAVDLSVCTLQREGEAIEAAADRAMRPEHLPPLKFCPARTGSPNFAESEEDEDQDQDEDEDEDQDQDEGEKLMDFLKEEVKAAVRVYDVEKALGVMEICGVCRRKPVVGIQISTLRCGHAFHCHCIVRRLMEEEDNCCPVCRRPAYDPPKPEPKKRYTFILDCEDDEVPGEYWDPNDSYL